jgi:hypothetical protein
VQSEEELEATQLRLLKYYVDIHAESIWHKWKADQVEPDWYTVIIRPVIQLFRGWNHPLQRCRYFADRNAFLMLIAWTELVRLMNVTRAALDKTQSENAPFPYLSQLHRKFIWAKERFNKENRTWKSIGRSVLDCEKSRMMLSKLRCAHTPKREPDVYGSGFSNSLLHIMIIPIANISFGYFTFRPFGLEHTEPLATLRLLIDTLSGVRKTRYRSLVIGIPQSVCVPDN